MQPILVASGESGDCKTGGGEEEKPKHRLVVRIRNPSRLVNLVRVCLASSSCCRRQITTSVPTNPEINIFGQSKSIRTVFHKLSQSRVEPSLAQYGVPPVKTTVGSMNMNKQLFLRTDEGEHPLYARIRDDPRGKEHLDHLEAMWSDYRDFAPKGFRRKLQFEFYTRWWEMYLTLGLVRLGFDVTSSRSDKGPDLFLEVAGTRLWIEAVAPSIGTTSDCVPEPIMNGFGHFPKRECLLRLTQGLEGKQQALAQYMQKSTIRPEDCCIIAISACNLNQFGSLLDWPCPAPLALLAGVGHMVVTLDGSREPYCAQQKSISRDSGSPVDTAMFDREEFRVVSAVLYSKPDPLNAPPLPESSFSLFLNPRAIRHVPVEVSATMEAWVEERRKTEIVWRITQPANADCYVAPLRV